MATRQTMVQLTEELVAVLDREAHRRDLSRSALIREILLAHLTEQVDARISEEIQDGYERFPPATPDGWDDLERFTDVASIEVLERLDAEERREGQGPW